MTLEGGGLEMADSLMAKLMLGVYLVVTSIVCMNLYIALLSDTFSRIYSEAQANSAILRAKVILSIENGLSKKTKMKYHEYIQTHCSPLVSRHAQEKNLLLVQIYHLIV